MKSELEQDIFRCVPKLHRKLLTRWILRLGALCLSLYALSFFVFKAFLVFTGFRTSLLVLFTLPLVILLCVLMLHLWVLSSTSSSEDIVYFDGGRVKVFIDQEDERIEIETLLLETKGSILEFLLAGLGGPFHESLLKTAAKAYSIQQGLEILGYRESQIKPRFRGDPLELQGEMFELSVRWYDQSGQKHEHALESWLYNQRQQKSLEAGGWVFTGSLRANASEEKGRVMLQADVLGHLIALYRDPSSLINTPLADAVHDSAFTTHPSALYPEPGTQVILILRHFQKPEASPQAATEAEEKPVSKQNE